MIELYHHGSSVCAAKVRMTLAEKGLEWEGHYIDILTGEQFTPEFMKLNPKAVVPVLVHDGNVITESTVICEYLDQVFPENPVMPKDPIAFTKMRYWSKAVDEELHPACGTLTFCSSHRHTIRRLGPEKLAEFLNSTPDMSVWSDWDEYKKVIVKDGFYAPGAAKKVQLYDKYLTKMEEALQDQDWLAGDDFTFADIALTPYVNRLDMLSMSGMWENGRNPRVTDWFKRIKARPSFKAQLIDWVPEQLTTDLKTFGAQSWVDVTRILEIDQAAA